MRALVVWLALALAAPAVAQDAPRAEPSRQVDLVLGQAAPFAGTLINRARAEELAAAAPSAACERDLAGCTAARRSLEATCSSGVAVGTVVGVVVVVGVTAAAVGVIAGVALAVKASK